MALTLIYIIALIAIGAFAGLRCRSIITAWFVTGLISGFVGGCPDCEVARWGDWLS